MTDSTHQPRADEFEERIRAAAQLPKDVPHPLASVEPWVPAYLCAQMLEHMRKLEALIPSAERDRFIPPGDADFAEIAKAYAALNEADYPVHTESKGFSAFNDVVRTCIRLARSHGGASEWPCGHGNNDANSRCWICGTPRSTESGNNQKEGP